MVVKLFIISGSLPFVSKLQPAPLLSGFPSLRYSRAVALSGTGCFRAFSSFREYTLRLTRRGDTQVSYTS